MKMPAGERSEERRVNMLSFTQWGEGFAAGCVGAEHRRADRSEVGKLVHTNKYKKIQATA